MTLDTEIRTLTPMELDEVAGGDFGLGFLLGSAVASAIIVAAAYGAFDSGRAVEGR